jgi:hypothetical protein
VAFDGRRVEEQLERASQGGRRRSVVPELSRWLETYQFSLPESPGAPFAAAPRLLAEDKPLFGTARASGLGREPALAPKADGACREEAQDDH